MIDVTREDLRVPRTPRFRPMPLGNAAPFVRETNDGPDVRTSVRKPAELVVAFNAVAFNAVG